MAALNDDPKADGIESTPEMIEAGADILIRLAHLPDGESPWELAAAVYRAMEMTRRISTPDRIVDTW